MTKQKLLELLDKNKNTEHVENKNTGRVAEGYDYGGAYCVVYINDEDGQHTICTGDIYICSSNGGEQIDWITISVKTMKELLEDKENDWVWEHDFCFEYEEGSEDFIGKSCPLRILKVDCEEITLRIKKYIRRNSKTILSLLRS